MIKNTKIKNCKVVDGSTSVHIVQNSDRLCKLLSNGVNRGGFILDSELEAAGFIRSESWVENEELGIMGANRITNWISDEGTIQVTEGNGGRSFTFSRAAAIAAAQPELTP